METECTASCGEGFRLLLPNLQDQNCHAAVLQVSPKSTIIDLHHISQVIPCSEIGCPVDCRWQAWSQWTECSPVRRRGRRRRREVLEEQLQEGELDEGESRVSVLIQEIPVVDSRQGATTSSECSQGRSR